jgi:uncharacterized protein
MIVQRSKVIRELRRVLEAQYEPEKIILFGSSAEGGAQDDSDIDLLIVKETSQPFYRRLTHVRQLVSPYRGGLPFDLIVLTPAELKQRLALGDQFLASILRSGTILYDKP